MPNLLVYCYFCPSTDEQCGGVQQIIGPLIVALQAEFGWTVNIAHFGKCFNKQSHLCLDDLNGGLAPDIIDPEQVIILSSVLREFAKNSDVILSIDRLLPCFIPIPAILMSNTINYQTEYAAVRSCQWKTIVVPSRHFGKLVRKIRPDVRVRVVPYGISARDLTLAKSIFPAKWPTYGATVRLPHRPDSRKGHREAIEGLSNALPASSNLVLEISWLEETRYEMYKRELKELANTLGVSNQVRFIPWVKTYDKWRNANRCVATLQLGVFEETFGLSLVESILIGRPVFTCCQPAVREVVGNSALLIELKEPQNWYTKFEEFWEKHNPDFVSDPERQRLLYASLQIERMAADYNKILRNTNVI